MKPRILTCFVLAALLPVVAIAQTKARKPSTTSRTSARTVAEKPPTAKPFATKPAAAGKPAAPPLATVNGSPISQAHLDQAVANRWAGQIMRDMIDDRLVRQEARKLGLKATPEDVAALYKAARDKYSSDQAFERHLLSQSLTSQGFNDKLTTEVLLTKLLARANAVSPEEARKYYAEHQAEYNSPAEIDLFAIVLNTVEDAYLARERLASGDKFEAVAKDLSQDPSRDRGGDMGWVRADALPAKSLADALFAMEPGVVSSPLRCGDKYWVALVKERKPGQTTTFEQAQKDIIAKLQAETAITPAHYLRMLERKATIVVAWPPARYLTAEFGRLRQIGVIVDDEPVDLSEPPLRLPSGSIIVAAKPVLQAVGAKLSWNAREQSLTATTATGRVKLTVGSPKAVVGLTTVEAREMPDAPVMRNGTLFISPRVALSALGADLKWDPAENALVITTIAKAMPSPTAPAARSGLEKQ